MARHLQSFLLLAALLARAHLAGSARLASFLDVDSKPVPEKAADSHGAEDASADELLEMTDSLAEDAAAVVRRFLETGAPTYPGPTPSPTPSPSPTPTPSPSPSPPLVTVVETVLNVSYDLKAASAEIVLNSTEAVTETVVDIVALVRESIAKTLGINLTQVVIKAVYARVNGVDTLIAGEWNALRHLLRRMAMEELPAPARSLADSLPALHGAPGELSNYGAPRPISLAEADRLMARGSSLTYQYDARRLLQGTGTGTGFTLDAINIDLSVVQYVEVPVEPSVPPPTTNTTTNGTSTNATSPSPLPRPSLIPINTTALTAALNATTINATATIIHTPSPTPTPPRVLFTKFKGIMADGVYTKGLEPVNASGAAPFVIWREDAAFDNWRRPRNRANLVHDKHLTCGANTVGACTTCPRAWQVTPDSTNATILFREPMQLDRIIIKQLQNPGVLTVQLLPWPAVRIPGLNSTVRTGTLGRPIWSVTSDGTQCGGNLTIPLGSRAGTSLAVPKRGSQSLIPRKLRSTTVGGINIIVKAQPKDCSTAPGCTFIESVLFDGRVLYPADPAAYTRAA